MGLMDNVRAFFSSSKNTQPVKIDNEYEKARIAEKIVDLIGDIKKINTFDSSIWNLSNTTIYQLQRKSLDELNIIKSKLENRLSELRNKSQRTDPGREDLEASKWTGEKQKNMSDLDFDRWQRSDDGR